MKPKHKRLLALLIGLIIVAGGISLVLVSFQQNIVFFYTPQDLVSKPIDRTRSVRIGGLVEVGSVNKNGTEVAFVITDNQSTVRVNYNGLLPTLFAEGQGVVAEGKLDGAGVLQAKTILAKHDENYMPANVVEALKKSGQWREGVK